MYDFQRGWDGMAAEITFFLVSRIPHLEVGILTNKFMYIVQLLSSCHRPVKRLIYIYSKILMLSMEFV